MIVIRHKNLGEAILGKDGRWRSDYKWWTEILESIIPDDEDERFTFADSFKPGGWQGIILKELKLTYGNDITVVSFKPEPVPKLEPNAVY